MSEAVLRSAGVPNALPEDGLSAYAIDGVAPLAVAFPSTVEEVSRTVRLAAGKGVGVTPYGGGVMMSLGNPPPAPGVVMVTRSLSRVVEYEPADLTVTVEAGVALAELQGRLAEEGQFLPLEAPCPERATVGGVLATAHSGPLSFAYGMPRDWLIGVKVVNANGAVTKGGGKVVKNVTGYDMNKLYTGSLGTLGVIVEAAFKVAPKPPAARTLVAGFRHLADALERASALLRSGVGPNAAIVVNGAASARLGLEPGGCRLLALFQGRQGIVDSRVGRAWAAVKEGGGRRADALSSDDGFRTWQRLTDLPWAGAEPPSLSVRFSLLPSKTAALALALDSLEVPPFTHGLVADVGMGAVRSLWWGGQGVPISVETVRRVTGIAESFGSRWVIEGRPAEVARELDVWGPVPAAMDIMRRVKAALDPERTLNPGRFVGGL